MINEFDLPGFPGLGTALQSRGRLSFPPPSRAIRIQARDFNQSIVSASPKAGGHRRRRIRLLANRMVWYYNPVALAKLHPYLDLKKAFVSQDAWEMEQQSLAQEVTVGNARILIGDSRDVLALLDSESVQCCVTSPPYWGLRDYEHPAQLGAEESPKQYVENLVGIFREVRRVLRPNGTFWLNVGDGYARNGGVGVCGPNAKVGNTKRLIQKRNCRVPDCWGLKDRDLLGLPWRVAFALQEDGWILRSKITWVKKTPMPESVRNRPSSATEEIFLFAKEPGYYYDNQAVRERSGANLRNYWMLGSNSGGGSHPAVFPHELARRCILLGSRPGDIVLDPFAGSGTTGIVAVELRRKAILVELNEAYARESEGRLRKGVQERLWA